MTDSQAGTFAATYDIGGNISTETRPDGLTVRHYYDENGQPTGLEYVTDPSCNTASCTLYYDYTGFDTHGKARWDSSSFSNGGYGYDNAGRLTGARQDTASGCALRTYQYNNASDRTKLTSYGPDANGNCQDSNPATTRTWSYDTADRATGSYTYDDLGRTQTVPAADLGDGTGTNPLTATYYTNDFLRSLSQGSTSTTYTMDVLAYRVRSTSTTTGGTTVTRTNHYSSNADAPAWTGEGTWYTRSIRGLGGLAASYTGASPHLEWQITNLHGDVVAMRQGSVTGLTSTYITDEFGRTLTTSSRYGYLGASQRSADNPGGIISMGFRGYNPSTGRFLQVDPVYAGSANNYDYANQDPVNGDDISGMSPSCSCGWVSASSTHLWKVIGGENYSYTGWRTIGNNIYTQFFNDLNPLFEIVERKYEDRYWREKWLNCEVVSRPKRAPRPS